LIYRNYWVLQGSIGCCLALPDFTGFYLVLPSFNEFYFDLPDITEFYWVLLGYYWVLLNLTRFRAFDGVS